LIGVCEADRLWQLIAERVGALDDGDAAGASTRHTAHAGAACIQVEQHARIHAQHRAAQPVIPVGG